MDSSVLLPVFAALILGLLVGTVLGWLWRHTRRDANAVTPDMLVRLKEKHQAELGLIESRGAHQAERIDSLSQSEASLREALDVARQETTRLDTLLNEARTQMQNQTEYFEALSQKTLKAIKAELEESARKEYTEKQTRMNEKITELLTPLHKIIKDNEQKVEALEKQHLKETVSLQKQIEMLVTSTSDLVAVKDRLADALSNSKGRGDWGEMELVRLLEESGLQAGTHYVAQQSEAGLRPDITIRLSNQRVLYVDAKTILVNLERLFAADALSDPETVAKERRKHADALEKEVLSLSAKSYESRSDASIDFVVLFVPRESMLRAALEEKPDLMELAFRKRVILASPLVLMSILKVVAYGWEQVQLSQNANEIRKLGQDLHKRAASFLNRFVSVGEAIEKASKQYHDAERGLTGRMGLMPQLLKFEELSCKSESVLPAGLVSATETLEEELATIKYLSETT